MIKVVEGKPLTFKGLNPPAIAYPTILLALVAVTVQISSSYLYVYQSLAFVAFSPMHDASHGSIATVNSGHKYLNDVIGMMCSWAFPLPYYPFKYMVGYISVLFNPRSSHLTSSDQTRSDQIRSDQLDMANTDINFSLSSTASVNTNSTCNIISGRMFQARYGEVSLTQDPDMYTAEGPWFLLPLKWMTIEYQYYRLYLPLAIRGLLGYTDNNARPFYEAVKSKIHLVAMIVIVAYLWRLDSYSLLCCWILPGRLAAFLLAFAFDYLPHRPHSHTRETDQVLTTSVTSLYGDNSIILTPFLLYQNYHNIHHLAPYIPFYHYLSVWDQVKGDLIKRGQLTITIFGTYEPRTKQS